MSIGDIVPIIQEEMITVNKACHTNSNLNVTRSIQEAPHFLSPMVSVQKPPLVHNFFLLVFEHFLFVLVYCFYRF